MTVNAGINQRNNFLKFLRNLLSQSTAKYCVSMLVKLVKLSLYLRHLEQLEQMSSKTSKKGSTPPISEEDKVSVEKRKQLSQEAALYYQSNEVPQTIQLLLNQMFFQKPRDLNGYITRFFSSRASNPIIHHFEWSQAIDANCNPATKVSLFAIVRGECELVAESTVSHNFGLQEDLPKNILTQSKSSMTNSRHNSTESQVPDKPSLADQSMNDREIIEFFNSLLEGKELNSLKECLDLISTSSHSRPTPPALLSALSLSLLVGLSHSTTTPLYQVMADIGEDVPEKYSLPHPLYHVLDGTGGKCKLADFSIAISPGVPLLEALKFTQTLFDKLRSSVKLSSPLSPDGAIRYNIDKIEQGFELLTETGKELELKLGEDVFVVVNANAGVRWDSERNKYEVNTGQWKSGQELMEYYNELIRNYPAAVLGIINAFHETDILSYCAFNRSYPLILLFQSSSETIKKVREEIMNKSGEEKTGEGNINSLVLSKRIEIPLINWIEDVRKREELGFALTHQPNTEVCSSFNVELVTGLCGSFIQVGSPRDKGTSLSLSRILSLGEELKSKKILKKNKQLLQVFSDLKHT